MGVFLFYLLWPLVWFYAPLRTRVRVILQHKDKVLVVKNWFGPGSWQLPGGGRKMGETPRATAAREIAEELAIELVLGDMVLLNDEPVITKSRGLLFRNQYVHVKVATKPLMSLSREVTATSWVHKKALEAPESIRRRIS